jgi:TATA-box binding protein (TBP) (component of TFIID and TFIIIB)
MTTQDQLIFPEFDNINVSTKTYTANTNLTIDIKALFEILPVTPYTVVVKRRGRKKKIDLQDPNEGIPIGSIITIKCEGESRGVDIKPKKVKAGVVKKWFRNSITIVIILDKPINFKICRNGTFQMTGCKRHSHAEDCIKYIWEYIKDLPNIYKINDGDPVVRSIFIPSMRNIDFSMGFLVDREKLNRYMSTQQKFHCLLETSFGYTGVNIKIPLENNIATMKVKKISYINGKWEEVMTTYQEYLDKLSVKDRQIKINNTRYNTFLVFHSGKVIMSGLTALFMKDIYYYFLDIIRECYNIIEERLIED